jgi:hypothetical protein
MKKRVSVKRNLINFIKGLLFLSTLFVFSCVKGGGDDYTSKITNTDTGEYALIQVSPNGEEIRIGGYKKKPNGETYGSWRVRKYGENFIPISTGGLSKVGFVFCPGTASVRRAYREEYVLQIKDKKFRLGYCQTEQIGATIFGCNPSPCGSYTWTSWYPLCEGHGIVRVPGVNGLSVEVDNGKLRLIYSNSFGNRAYGNWISVHCVSCPSGYTYNPSRNVCEAQPTFTCPYTGKSCLKATDGHYYCSPYNCYNAATTPTQITDTPQGINDKKNDAPITSKGCLGNIYIFNGHDMRCRPPGVQTGFSDCCKKTKRWFGLLRCSPTEKELAALRDWGKLDGSCHYVGEYCTEKWLGVCVQKKKTYCCYSSPLARIIVEAAHKQLGIPWGSPESPNCRGLTPEEFQKLDFSKVDFSEWVDYEVKTNIIPTVNTSLSNAINNLKTTVQSSY